MLAFEKERAAEKPPADKPAVPERPAPNAPAPGPQGPLDPATIAAHLTGPQATELYHLAQAQANDPKAPAQALRTGKRLEAAGLVQPEAERWRITPLGIAVTEHIPDPDKAPTERPNAGTRRLSDLSPEQATAAERMAQRIDDLAYNSAALFDDPKDQFHAARMMTRSNRVALLAGSTGLQSDDALWLTNRMHDRTPRQDLYRRDVQDLVDAIPGAADLLGIERQSAERTRAGRDGKPDSAQRFEAALGRKDLKGALEVLAPLTLHKARAVAAGAGFAVPDGGTKADLYRTLQQQLLAAADPRKSSPTRTPDRERNGR